MKRNIFKSLLLSALCILAVSCVDTDDFAKTLYDGNKTQVVFSIGMDSPIARSRATWGDDYSPSELGDAYDNRIDPNQLYVKIIWGGETYHVKNILNWQDKNNVSSHTFVGEVDIELGNAQSKQMDGARIEVFANWNPDAENGHVFSQDAAYIPMWGVQTADITLAKGKRETLETIYLLRAMAKLQVSLTEEMAKEYALKKVTLNKHNTTGYCLPTLPESGVDHTKELGLEDVLNANDSDSQSEIELPVVTEGKDYIVYLPEITNGTTEEDYLKVNVEFDNGEEGSFFVMNYPQEGNPEAIDIVRNHWYKYEIKGFAASEIQLNYTVLDWQGVGIEIGGEGFLFLNKDVVEIYNSNIDADQLKFSSSSPIKSIVLKDLYKHYRNGEIKETPVGEEADAVYAYYMDKFGVLTQLSNEEGSDEAVVLANITAEVKEENKEVLNGGIVINSPFMADNSADESALQSDSHYDTVRYLEFEVENEQGLKATFRVMQYPPVVITNEEGFFSYRDDFTRKDDEEPAYWTNYMGPGSVTAVGLSLYHEHDWTEERNQDESWWNTRQSDRSYGWLDDASYPWMYANNQCANAGSTGEQWEEMRYAMIAHSVPYKDASGKETSGFYQGGYRPSVHPTKMFLRERYKGLPGTAAGHIDSKGVALGDYYEKEIEIDGVLTKRTFRKHYSWDVQTIFWSKYVSKVYKEDGYNNAATPRRRLKGQADIIRICDNYSTPEAPATGFTKVSADRLFRNHRMYHIVNKTASEKYNLGYPSLVDENGNPTNDTERGVVANIPSNANKVSPSLMLASQLGETAYNYIVEDCKKYGYVLPNLSDFFKFAERHCREYVEASYNDINNNGSYDEGEPITQYHDWRLPTKEEINLIIDLQTDSRAMDKVLLGEHFMCVTGNPGSGNDEEYWVSKEVPGFNVSAEEDLDGIAYNNYGYYIRCVRDVKTGENK